MNLKSSVCPFVFSKVIAKVNIPLAILSPGVLKGSLRLLNCLQRINHAVLLGSAKVSNREVYTFMKFTHSLWHSRGVTPSDW